MEFVEILSFWCPHVDRATCNNFRTRTVELQPSENRAIFPFPSSFLSFPFSFLLFFLRTPSPWFPFFLSFLLFFSFPISHFISSSFLFHILFFSLSPLFCIFSPLWSNIDRMGQSRKFPPHFLIPFNVVLNFLHFSFISYFFYCITHPCGSL